MGSIFEFDEYEFDVDNLELRRAGVATKADGLLLRLLEVFVRSPGQLVTKEELLARVWDGRTVSENSLTVAVTRLRRVLQHERGVRDVVVTVHGHGYRFLPEVIARDAPARAAHGTAPSAGVAPFVGRERLMTHLRSAMQEAQSGNGSAIVLAGEPGIGKTRAAEVLAHEAATENVAVAWAYCRELDDMSPLWPFAGLLRDAIARLPHAAMAGDSRLSALLPELVRVLPELATTEPVQPSMQAGSKQRVFDAVVRVLALAAEHTPYLLILDDIGRADAASLELLHYLFAELPRMRVLLVATLRSDEESAASLLLLRVITHRNCARLGLLPLSEDQVTRYVVALLGNVDKTVSRAVFERSGGNPLFMSEFVRQLRTSEQLDIKALETPSFALALLRERVAGIDAAAREALTCAAVIGRSFGLPLLQAITGRTAPDLIASLDEAVAREVLMPALDSPTQFVFAHELFRDALYESLSPAQRRTWHLRVVQALDGRVMLGEVPVADLAYHARAALPEGDLRKTVQYCIEASNAAARVYAYQDAVRNLQHARQALDLVPDASARFRFGLLWRQAALTRGYSAQEFRPLAEQLLVLARELDTGVALAQAAMLLDSFPGFPRLPGSRAALLESLEHLPEDAHCTRAVISIRLATSAPLTEPAVESAALARSFEIARRSAELGDRITAGFAQLYLYGGPAHKPRAAEALRELQDICNADAAALTMPLVLLDIHRALTASQDGDLATMTRALERNEARCREYGIEMLWHVKRFRALSRINAGHAAEGRAALLELHQRALGAGPNAATELFCAYDQSVVLAADDDRDEAWHRALAPDAGDPPNIWALKVRALAAAGAEDEARSALTAVPATALTQLMCDREYLGTLGALARAALTLQAPDYARVLYELLLPYPEHFAINLAFRCEGSVSQLLGMLARSFGESAQARKHLDLAIAASEQAGFSTCAAEARLERDLC